MSTQHDSSSAIGREYQAVQYTRLKGGFEAWLISQYEEIATACTLPDLSCDPRHAAEYLARVLGPSGANRPDLRMSILTADPPEHTRLRSLAAPAFTQHRAELLRPRIRRLAVELVERQMPHGRADIMEDLAFPLSITVMCDVIGLPRHAVEQIRLWTDQALLPTTDERSIQAMLSTLDQWFEYLTAELRRKRLEPAADLLTDLLRAQEAGDVTEDDAVQLAVAIMLAGIEAPASVIGWGMFSLAQDKTAMDELRSNPSMLTAAVEEIIRLRGPVRGLPRYSAQDTVVGGVHIPRGMPVILAIGKGNVDPLRFEQPTKFDIHREHDGHLGFGRGIHRCPGASLGRIEVVEAIKAAVGLLPDLALALSGSRPRPRNSNFVSSLAELPITFSPTPKE